MADFYLVEEAKGPAWDPARGRREQAVRARLAEDPWMHTVLTIASVRPWSIWLRATATERR